MDPQNISITFPHALIFFPLLAGLITFLLKKDAAVAFSAANSKQDQANEKKQESVYMPLRHDNFDKKNIFYKR